jgi:hypothetical protein
MRLAVTTITTTITADSIEPSDCRKARLKRRVFLRASLTGGKQGFRRLRARAQMLIESIESTPFWIPQE